MVEMLIVLGFGALLVIFYYLYEAYEWLTKKIKGYKAFRLLTESDVQLYKIHKIRKRLISFYLDLYDQKQEDNFIKSLVDRDIKDMVRHNRVNEIYQSYKVSF